MPFPSLSMPRHRVMIMALLGVVLASGLGVMAYLALAEDVRAGLEPDAIGEVTGTQWQAVPVPPTGEWAGVCQVEGADSDYLRLVAVGGCSYSVHQDGDRVYAAFDGNLTGQVDPRTLHVTVADARRASDADDPVWQLDYDGLLDGDTVVTAPTVNHPPRDAAPGIYALGASGGSVPDYRLAYTRGTLTIDPVLTVTTAPSGALPPRVVVPYGTVPSLAPAEIVSGTFYVSTDDLSSQVTTNRSVSYSTIPVQIAAAPLTYRVAGLLRSKWDAFQDAYLAGDTALASTRLSDLTGEANAVSGTGELVRHLVVIRYTMFPSEYLP